MFGTILRIAVVSILWVSTARATEAPTIAAAADLQFALSEVAQNFERATGKQVKLSFGSSGTFTTQLQNAAPYELFLSADENYIFKLADAGIALDRGALYAIGRIVLFVPNGSPLKPDAEFNDLKAAIADGRVSHFAIANPVHAPYGRAARAALQNAGIWADIEPKLVFGQNAGQAMLFAYSGSTQGGIVPLSLGKAPEHASRGASVLIPAEMHADEPLRQRMALMKGAGETATAFYLYLQQPAAREVFVRYGFVLPGDDAGK